MPEGPGPGRGALLTKTPPVDIWLRCYNLRQAAYGQLKERCHMQVLALFGPIGLPEMLIILAIVILIFGANRLPELGRGIGAGIKNFKSSIKDTDKID
jgi:sec-independent protein translocase protein TatA